jgi:hypothetical protein
MVIEACRAVLTERCRLMCKQRGRQQMVRATTPFPANPMETYTGCLCPGTVTLRTRIE